MEACGEGPAIMVRITALVGKTGKINRPANFLPALTIA